MLQKNYNSANFFFTSFEKLGSNGILKNDIQHIFNKFLK